MATRMCDVCGIRPAVVTVRRIIPGEGQRVEHLCEIHAAEAGAGRSAFGDRSPLGGGSLFDDFFGRFFDQEPTAGAGGGRGMASPTRQAEQVDITQFFSDSTTQLLQRAAQQALEWGSLDLTSEHLLYAALQDGVVRRLLDEVGADADAIRAQLEEEAQKGERTDVSPSLAPDAKRALLGAYEESRDMGSSYIGPEHVLLALAADDESDAARLLSRFGLSHLRLRGAVVRGVDTSGEAREHSDDLILFIDELHTVVGAGAAEGSMDASNMLKPALSRGELHVVGATTIDEYRKNIEKDAALERRFQPVLVSEPTVDDTIDILRGLKDRYEAHHRVKITEEAIIAAAELSDRYITGRFLPDKAIDLMDQAAARVRLRSKTKPKDTKALEDELRRVQREKDEAVANEDFEKAPGLRDRVAALRSELEEAQQGRRPVAEVTAEDIAEVVSRATGIPVSQLTEEERERLMRLEEQLHERVVGQDEAVKAVAEAIRRARAGLSDSNRPIGSFLFLGPTGVGKTELARTLAEALFGDEAAMVRIDMSEFQERHTVSRLVGAPPGYVGYEEAGQLTESVRRRPYSVLLLDEIEKAHPDVFNILLQILDDGRLTDSQGRTVDFRHTVVIMTSNLGADRIQAHARRGESFDDLKAELMEVLRQSFRPELLNRIDEIIVFRSLDRAQLMQITRLLLDRVARRIHAQRVELEVSDEAVEYLANAGFDPQYGARPLRRAIQRLLEDELSERLLAGEIEPGQGVRVELRDGRLHVGPVGSRSSPDAETAGSAA